MVEPGKKCPWSCPVTLSQPASVVGMVLEGFSAAQGSDNHEASANLAVPLGAAAGTLLMVEWRGVSGHQ